MSLMSDDANSIEIRLINRYRSKGLVLAVAESCTGGSIAGRITSVPGASAVFLGGVVSYANSAKRDVLGVPQEVLDRAGAVSSDCAIAMAIGVRERFHADVTVAVTGLAGPDGGSALKPVGTVYFGLATAAGVKDKCCYFSGDRAAVRQQAAEFALTLLLDAVG